MHVMYRGSVLILYYMYYICIMYNVHVILHVMYNVPVYYARNVNVSNICNINTGTTLLLIKTIIK